MKSALMDGLSLGVPMEKPSVTAAAQATMAAISQAKCEAYPRPKDFGIRPGYTTPDELAVHFGASKRCVRGKVRELGCYSQVGGRMIMFMHHLETFLESIECPSKSKNAAKSGTTQAVLPEGDSGALRERLTKRKPKKSPRKRNPTPGTVVSMGRERL